MHTRCRTKLPSLLNMQGLTPVVNEVVYRACCSGTCHWQMRDICPSRMISFKSRSSNSPLVYCILHQQSACVTVCHNCTSQDQIPHTDNLFPLSKVLVTHLAILVRTLMAATSMRYHILSSGQYSCKCSVQCDIAACKS